MSIQEVWKAEIVSLGLLEAVQAEVEEVFRKAMMAVLDEAFNDEAHHPALCGVWSAAFNDLLRERIERLGESDGTCLRA